MPRRVPRKTMRDVVVCIPGITGSVLRKDGRDVWNISGRRAHQCADDARPEHRRSQARAGSARRGRSRRRDHGAGGDPRRPSDPGALEDRRVHEDAALHRGDVRRHARPEPLRVPVRLAAGQPCRGAAPPAAVRRVAEEVASVERRGRRQARARRPFDGRADLALLPRMPRRVARDADARHVRDALPRLGGRAGHPRQRQEDQVLRPDRGREVADSDLPAAPDVSVLRRRRRCARVRRRGRRPEPGPGEDQGRARLPSRDRRRGRRASQGSRLPQRAATTSLASSASSNRRSSRPCATAIG